MSLGLARAIEEVNNIVKDCEDVQHIYDTARVQEAIISLYGLIFDLFRGILDWYMRRKSRRMLGSFNADLYSDFEDQVEQVRTVGRSIHDHAWKLGASAEIRAMRVSQRKYAEWLMIRDEEYRTRLADAEEQSRRQNEAAGRIAASFNGNAYELTVTFEQQSSPTLFVQADAEGTYLSPSGRSGVHVRESPEPECECQVSFSPYRS